MDVQRVIDTAIATHSSSLGQSEAAALFRTNYKSAIKVHVNLKPSQVRLLQSISPHPLVFLGGVTPTNDHPMLVTMRDITRTIYEGEFRVSKTKLRTIVLGSSVREISLYASNPNIHHYIHGSETKDYDRIIRPALEKIGTRLKTKASKGDKRLFYDQAKDIDALKPVVKRYLEHQKIFDDYVKLMALPPLIHTTLGKCEIILSEDTIYNYDSDGICKLLHDTGASAIYGYCMLPLELLFPDMPKHSIYSYSVMGDSSVLTFNNGHCNGYIHKTKNWSTLLRTPAYEGKQVSYAVEITSRLGPMVTFKILRCSGNPEEFVRRVELQPHEMFVRLLDVTKSYNQKTGDFDKLVYFSVIEGEFHQVVNYLSSLDAKSVSLQNCINFVRRRMGGVSLSNNETLAPWDLPKGDVYKFCLIVTMFVMRIHHEASLIMDSFTKYSESQLTKFFKSVKRYAMMPLSIIFALVEREGLSEKMVEYPEGFVMQHIAVGNRNIVYDWLKSPSESNHPHTLDAKGFSEDDDANPCLCQVCADYYPNKGKQLLECHSNSEEVEISMTDEEISKFRATLADNDLDPPGIKAVKERALKVTPRSGFSHMVKVEYIFGGPGCGKSHFIVNSADQHDLVMAPFNKLAPDYTDAEGKNGEKLNLLFKTTHRALETTGRKRIFLDEFTSMPYEFLAVAVHNNAAETVFLVGDTKQTKVQEPEEGTYIGSRIDMSKVSRHELKVNFRNPKLTVCLLNKLYDYSMIPFSKDVESYPEIVNTEFQRGDKVALSMGFSHASSEINTSSRNCTVRSNQGQTFPDVILYANTLDGGAIKSEELQIVGLSRHTNSLTIVSDNSPEALCFLSRIPSKEDFLLECDDYLGTFDEVLCETTSHHVVDIVLSKDDSDTMNSSETCSLSSDTCTSYTESVGIGSCVSSTTACSDWVHNEGLNVPEYQVEYEDLVDGPLINVNDRFKDVPQFSLALQNFMIFQHEDSVRKRVTSESGLRERFLQPGRDSYLLTGSALRAPGFIPGITSLNLNESQVIRGNFTNGVMSEDAVNGINLRGHPISCAEKYFSYAAGNGCHFSSKKPMQTLQVLSARYLCATPFFKFGTSQRFIIREMIDLWFYEHVNQDHVIMNDFEISDVIQGFVKKVTSSKYAEQFIGMDNPDAGVIRLHLKGIFKPKCGDVDPYKAGQGISAWSVDLNTMYCAIFRILGRFIIKSEKSHVLTDSYKADECFISDVMKQFSLIDYTAKNGVTDGEMFDASQNGFTQEIEKTYYRRLGVNEELLEHYYSFRSNYTILTREAVGVAGFQKTSGEPGTLINNGIVSKIISNYVLRGQGPVGIVYKGDDFNKRQVGLKVDETRLAQVHASCPLKIRVAIQDDSEFCGLTFVGGALFPSLPRKLNKIAAHRFRDYEHFAEYQNSLRDFVDMVTRLGTFDVIAGNMKLYGSSEGEMTAMYDMINSWAHISKNQFMSVMTYHTEESGIPTFGDSESGIVMLN